MVVPSDREFPSLKTTRSVRFRAFASKQDERHSTQVSMRLSTVDYYVDVGCVSNSPVCLYTRTYCRSVTKLIDTYWHALVNKQSHFWYTGWCRAISPWLFSPLIKILNSLLTYLLVDVMEQASFLCLLHGCCVQRMFTQAYLSLSSIENAPLVFTLTRYTILVFMLKHCILQSELIKMKETVPINYLTMHPGLMNCTMLAKLFGYYITGSHNFRSNGEITKEISWKFCDPHSHCLYEWLIVEFLPLSSANTVWPSQVFQWFYRRPANSLHKTIQPFEEE